MKPKWTSRPDTKPGNIIGGWTPESDLDHFMVCPRMRCHHRYARSRNGIEHAGELPQDPA